MPRLPNIDSFLATSGEAFTVIRDGNDVAEHVGLRNRSDADGRYVGFKPNTDVREGDILRSNLSGEQLHVVEVRPDTRGGSLFQQMAFYRSGHELRAESKAVPPSTTLNIENATNAIIGNQQSAEIRVGASLSEVRQMIDERAPDDAAELHELVRAVEAIISAQQPANKGVLNRFSEVMQRNAWITSPLVEAFRSLDMMEDLRYPGENPREVCHAVPPDDSPVGADPR